jgi:hypothetical protein
MDKKRMMRYLFWTLKISSDQGLGLRMRVYANNKILLEINLTRLLFLIKILISINNIQGMFFIF